MTARLRILLETRPFEQVEAEVAVASVFREDRPLRGAAGRADWRLCGMLSGLLVAEHFSGAAGEALLVPTFGCMRSPRLLLVGLGGSGRFGPGEVSEAARDAVSRALELGLGSAALAIPGEWIGAVPARPAAEAVARGALEAVAARQRSFDLALLVSEANAHRALRGLEAASSRARASEVDLRLPDLAPRPAPPLDVPASAGRRARPVSPSHDRP